MHQCVTWEFSSASCGIIICFRCRGDPHWPPPGPSTDSGQRLGKHPLWRLAFSPSHRPPSVVGSGPPKLPLWLGPGALCRCGLPPRDVPAAGGDAGASVQKWSYGVSLIEDAQRTPDPELLRGDLTEQIQRGARAPWRQTEQQHLQSVSEVTAGGTWGQTEQKPVTSCSFGDI